MKKTIISLLSMAVIALSSGAVWADGAVKACPMPKPTAEHTWLQQLVGEWTSETESYFMPGAEPTVSKGSESVRALGPFWTITEVKGQMMQMPFAGNMTLGYDKKKQVYVGTWVDSMTGKLWEYEGKLNPSKTILTLETEGECPMMPGKVIKHRDTLEIKDANHKVYKSQMLRGNGKWATIMTSHAERKQVAVSE